MEKSSQTKMFSNYLNKIKKRHIDWWETTYLLIYAIILVFTMWGTTMFPDIWPSRFGMFTYVIIMIYVVAKGIKKFTYNRYETILAVVIGMSFLICAFKNDMYSFLFMLAFLIVGAKDVSIDKILKGYLVIGIVMMVAAFACSHYGIIENLQYWKNEKMRFSFGIVYPTDFAAHIFYIILATVCLFNRKIHFVESIIICIVACVVFKWTVASTSFICMIGYSICLVCISIVQMLSVEVKDNWFWKMCSITPVGFALLFIGMTILYDENNQTWLLINDKLSDRLTNSKIGLDINGFNLFGQYIEERGWGKSVIEKADYFYLDDSYIRIMLEYGIIVFVVVLAIFFIASRRAAKAGRMEMVLAIAFIALHSFMEHHLLEVAYNPFILCVFSNLCSDRRKTDA